MSVLHIVATPIGNLEDVTLRALRVLGEVELVLAEDTRRTRILLDHHGVKTRPVSLHAHNEAARVARALAVLDAGRDIALVADAGTPLISDPGERLVEAVLAAGHEVTPVPGASAVLGALSASGLPPIPFTFVGFAPRRAGEFERLLESLRERPDTLVLFESPRRIAVTLARLRAALGNRRACVARELTKRYEEIARGSLDELASQFADGARGELTIVVAGAPAATRAVAIEELDDAIRVLAAEGQSSKQISEALTPESGLSRRVVYARVVELKSQRPRSVDE